MGISNNYWRYYWDNIRVDLLINKGWKHWWENSGIKLRSSLGKMRNIREIEIHEGFYRKTEYLQQSRY